MAGPLFSGSLIPCAMGNKVHYIVGRLSALPLFPYHRLLSLFAFIALGTHGLPEASVSRWRGDSSSLENSIALCPRITADSLKTCFLGSLEWLVCVCACWLASVRVHAGALVCVCMLAR